MSDSANSESTPLHELILPENSSLSMLDPQQLCGGHGRSKSQRRKAAEALLSGRYSTADRPPISSLPSPSASQTLHPPQALYSSPDSQPIPLESSPAPCSCNLQPYLPFCSFATAGLNSQAGCNSHRMQRLTATHQQQQQQQQQPSQHQPCQHHPALLQCPPPQHTPLSHLLQPTLPPIHAHAHALSHKRTHASLASGSEACEQAKTYGLHRPPKRPRVQPDQLHSQVPQPKQLTSAPSSASSSATGSTEARSSRRVPACPPSCATASSWCSFDVHVPHVDWHQVFKDSPSSYSYSILSRGYDKFYLGHGLEVYMVDNPAHAEDAVRRLRASMLDPVVTIDLEWKPEWRADQDHPVALLQLSSATVCVLVHTSSMGFMLPAAVRELLVDPQVHILGFGWDNADERKMQRTFQMGRKSFGNFLDLQEMAKQLSFPSQMGLLKLTKQVLGHDLVKAKAVSRSNWSLRHLSLHQIKYAAMDVLACGQVFRALRLWHSSPSACPGCQELVGALLPVPVLQCPTTKRVFSNLRNYLDNASKLKVTPSYMQCAACGRYVPSKGGQR